MISISQPVPQLVLNGHAAVRGRTKSYESEHQLQKRRRYPTSPRKISCNGQIDVSMVLKEDEAFDLTKIRRLTLNSDDSGFEGSDDSNATLFPVASELMGFFDCCSRVIARLVAPTVFANDKKTGQNKINGFS